MHSSKFSILTILALAALASAIPIPLRAGSSVSPLISDINTATPGLMTRDVESRSKHDFWDDLDFEDGGIF
ncbi:hypothetical protein JMJ35_010511 [Cladonia borealis]|uniref:Uncharacterized protein n=1 Tax=Cladonia borealis TaxID=184061 RepID=A0AA39QSS6_9LECA|nr:hypothetical protein JMJ35_010511 [Cladonia borealis]